MDKGKKTVFLDRDGVINVQAAPHDYIRKWSQFKFLPYVQEAIKALNDQDFLIILVTNQRGVARGLMTMDDVYDIHRHMQEALKQAGAHVDDIYVCPHEEGTCHCRKPDIGLFLQAEQDFPIDKSRSYMVGDSESDIIAGKSYGVKTIAVNKDFLGADFRCKSLKEAADKILEEEQK